MSTHYMSLDDRWFCNVRDGTKPYEVRIWDPKRKEIKAYDRIIFTNKQTAETCEKKVAGFISGFKTFRSIFNTFNYEQIVPGVKNIDEACEIYYNIPGYVEKMKEHTGVVYKLDNI